MRASLCVRVSEIVSSDMLRRHVPINSLWKAFYKFHFIVKTVAYLIVGLCYYNEFLVNTVINTKCYNILERNTGLQKNLNNRNID